MARVTRRPNPPARGPHGAPLCGYEDDQVCPGHRPGMRTLRDCTHLTRGSFCPFYPQIKANRAGRGPTRPVRIIPRKGALARLLGR
jgi:hypothetical protein